MHCQNSRTVPRRRTSTIRWARLTKWLDNHASGNEKAFALKRAGKIPAAIKAYVDRRTATGVQLITDFAHSKTVSANAATAAVQTSSRAAIIASVVGAVTAILAGAAMAFALGGDLQASARCNRVHRGKLCLSISYR
jgi:hypothetical protein